MAKRLQLTGSQDLLTYYNLIPIYKKYFRSQSPRAKPIDATLFPYISELPGKYDVEPDGYLLNLLRDPQALENDPKIRRIDTELLEEAFSLKEGPVPGFDASILGTDESGPSTYSGGNVHYLHTHEKDHGVSAGEDVSERKHKKKKKKRKHSHDEEGHSHEHKKKKKRKKEKEYEKGYRNENEELVVD
ncbi:hypothetical protein BDF14DRAFT_1785388 [Spinellus fusiger]|nr:hypothetical protein BDF14DRAFT_1785388 [Spinellus fusiger]